MLPSLGITSAFRLAIVFIIGIVLAHYGNFQLQTLFITALFVAGLFGFSWIISPPSKGKPTIQNAIALCFTLVLGMIYLTIANQTNHPKHIANYLNTQPNELRIKLIKLKGYNPYGTYRALGEVVEIKLNKAWKPTCGNCIVKLNHFPTHQILNEYDLIEVTAQSKAIREPLNPFQFNVKEYYLQKNTHLQLEVNTGGIKKITPASTYSIARFASKAKQYFLKELKKINLTPQGYAVAAAMLLGDEQTLDQELRMEYAVSGVLHILSVSGLHVGLVAYLLIYLLKPLHLSSSKLKYATAIIVALIWLYALITGFSSPVVRSAAMFTFIEFGRFFNRRSSLVNSLSLSALLVLLINPYWVFDIGFQLSYTAVLGIAWFTPILQSMAEPEHWLWRHLHNWISVSIAAQLGTLPFSLYYFHQFPTYFLIANILLIPLSTLLLYLGIAYLCLSKLKIAGIALGYLLSKTILLLNNCTRYISKLPGAQFNHIFCDTWVNLLICLAFICLIVAFYYKSTNALLCSIAAVLSVVGYNCFNHYQSSNQKELVILAEGNESSLQLRNGTDLYTFNVNSPNIEKVNPYTRDGYLTRHPVSREFPAEFNKTRSIQQLTVNTQTWLLMPDTLPIRGQLQLRKPIDYCLAHAQLPAGYWNQLTNTGLKLLVLKGYCSMKRYEKWKQWASEHHIRIHLLQHNGAFLSNLQL